MSGQQRGSKVLNLCPEPRRSELKSEYLEEFQKLVPIGAELLSCCQVRVLEMSTHCTFWNLKQGKDVIESCGLEHQTDVPRCSYDGGPKEVVAQHSYRLRSNEPGMFRLLKKCTCESHIGLNRQSLDLLGEYPFGLAFRLARNFISR